MGRPCAPRMRLCTTASSFDGHLRAALRWSLHPPASAASAAASAAAARGHHACLQHAGALSATAAAGAAGDAAPSSSPRRVAVVGGGFAGLAVSWHLLEAARAAGQPLQLQLFDAYGLGAGGSGAAAGLLHPYTPRGKVRWARRLGFGTGESRGVTAGRALLARRVAAAVPHACARHLPPPPSLPSSFCGAGLKPLRRRWSYCRRQRRQQWPAPRQRASAARLCGAQACCAPLGQPSRQQISRASSQQTQQQRLPRKQRQSQPPLSWLVSCRGCSQSCCCRPTRRQQLRRQRRAARPCSASARASSSSGSSRQQQHRPWG